MHHSGGERSRGFTTRATATLEPLERRTLMSAAAAGTAAGVVFLDGDGNGRRARREPGVEAVTVYVDLNRNLSLDAGEPAVTTGAGGRYQFTGLAAGSYTVATSPPQDLIAARGGASANLTARRGAKVAPIALLGPGSIGGTVFWDANVDGSLNSSSFGERPLRGIGVYLDLNGDRVRQKSEPVARTDANGRYRFTGLTAGSYHVRTMRKGWQSTAPSWPVSIGADIGWGGVRSIGMFNPS
jgi:hypothetical protein